MPSGRFVRALCPDCGKWDLASHVCSTETIKTNFVYLKAAGTKRTPSQRELELVVLYQGGCTLEEIGAAVGLTRERVRQLIAYHGFSGKDKKGWRRESLENLSEKMLRETGIGRERWETRRKQRQDRIVNGIRAIYQRVRRAPGLDELFLELWPEREGKTINPSAFAVSYMMNAFRPPDGKKNGAYATQAAYDAAGVPRPEQGARWLRGL